MQICKILVICEDSFCVFLELDSAIKRATRKKMGNQVHF